PDLRGAHPRAAAHARPVPGRRRRDRHRARARRGRSRRPPARDGRRARARRPHPAAGSPEMTTSQPEPTRPDDAGSDVARPSADGAADGAAEGATPSEPTLGPQGRAVRAVFRTALRDVLVLLGALTVLGVAV